MKERQIYFILIIFLLLIILIIFLKYLFNLSNKSNDLILSENKEFNYFKNDIEPTFTDYIKNNNKVNEKIPLHMNPKINQNMNSHLLKTNGFEYNEWILPDNYNYNIVKTQEKSLPYWDSQGVSITKEEKSHHTIPKELPNLGDAAVVKNNDDWLFDPDRGLLNNWPV